MGRYKGVVSSAAKQVLEAERAELQRAMNHYDLKDFTAEEKGFLIGYRAAALAKEENFKFIEDAVIDETNKLPDIIQSNKTTREDTNEELGLKVQDKPRWDIVNDKKFSKFSLKDRKTNKVDLRYVCSRISKSTPYTYAELVDVSYLLLNEIIKSVLEGKQVSLCRFGIFELKYNKTRRIVNPFYGEFMSEPSVSLKFKLHRELQRFIRHHSSSIISYLNHYSDEFDLRKGKE